MLFTLVVLFFFFNGALMSHLTVKSSDHVYVQPIKPKVGSEKKKNNILLECILAGANEQDRLSKVPCE